MGVKWNFLRLNEDSYMFNIFSLKHLLYLKTMNGFQQLRLQTAGWNKIFKDTLRSLFDLCIILRVKLVLRCIVTLAPYCLSLFWILWGNYPGFRAIALIPEVLGSAIPHSKNRSGFAKIVTSCVKHKERRRSSRIWKLVYLIE